MESKDPIDIFESELKKAGWDFELDQKLEKKKEAFENAIMEYAQSFVIAALRQQILEAEKDGAENRKEEQSQQAGVTAGERVSPEKRGEREVAPGVEREPERGSQEAEG